MAIEHPKHTALPSFEVAPAPVIFHPRHHVTPRMNHLDEIHTIETQAGGRHYQDRIILDAQPNPELLAELLKVIYRHQVDRITRDLS